MILPDTSVWIHHFRKSSPELCGHLTNGQVAMHPFVLASSMVSGFNLWTHDKRLHQIASTLSCSHP